MHYLNKSLLFLIFFIFFANIAFGAEKIDEIVISGNQRIEKEVFFNKIQSKKGDDYDEIKLSEDMQTLYKMGYFDDIKIAKETNEKGVVITFVVKEKPSVRKIIIKGNSVYESEKIVEEIKIKKGSILNVFEIQESLRIIKGLYIKKNYYNTSCTYEIEESKKNSAELTFIIDEGEKAYIREINFEGNKAFKDKKLKKKMESSEKGFFSWLTESGKFDKNLLFVDSVEVLNFYKNSGYVDAKVSEPDIKREKDRICVTIKIEEGDKFYFGEIDIDGDILTTKKDILSKIKIVKGEPYSQLLLQQNITIVSNLYADKGYANVDVVPLIKRDGTNHSLNVVFKIDKKEKVYFDKIFITGNDVTRDKVIRRELKVYEKELYSLTGVRRSIKNLHKLGYFKDVKTKIVESTSNEQKNLKIEVEEGSTGMFTVGGGYSSENDFFFKSTLGKRNLFGRGQSLDLSAELGEEYDSYSLSFTEPWLFDIPLLAGFSIYKLDREYTDYDRDSTGHSLKLGYRFFDYTTSTITYSYDKSDVNDITRETGDPIYNYEGINKTKSFTIINKYDSTDRYYNPTEGKEYKFLVEYAGGFIGGDIEYTKYILEAGHYYPLFWKTVGFLHTRFGYIDERNSFPLDYERFHLGGMYSVRGFKSKDITVYQDEAKQFRIGGDKYALFNAEFLFPIAEDAGLMGLFFYDAGDVYDDDENMFSRRLNSSYGGGFRWFSPAGPLRLEYGRTIHSNDDSVGGDRWEFTVGIMF